MCVSPSYIFKPYGPEGTKIPVPCKLCWRCRSNRLNDYVGRALAESATSDWTVTLTLTYAPTQDGLSEKVLTPRHFQNFVRSMRKRGHKIRYIGTGEYGELKGRAHFHCILFGKGKPPEIPHQKNTHIDAWPHGHVFADWNADHGAMRYVCKYILKHEGTDSWFTLSKKPTIGAEWFARKAQQAVDKGVLPSSFEYLPPGGKRGHTYLLTGATRRDYINAVMAGWLERRELDTTRLSAWVSTVLESEDRRRHRAAIDSMTAHQQWEAISWTIEQKRPSARQLMAQWFHEQRRAQAAQDLLSESYGHDLHNVQESLPEGYRTLLKSEWQSWHVNEDSEETEAEMFVGDPVWSANRILGATLSELRTRDVERRSRSLTHFTAMPER